MAQAVMPVVTESKHGDKATSQAVRVFSVSAGSRPVRERQAELVVASSAALRSVAEAVVEETESLESPEATSAALALLESECRGQAAMELEPQAAELVWLALAAMEQATATEVLAFLALVEPRQEPAFQASVFSAR